MARPLYLDTARLGLMSPSAQRAHRDFLGLAGEAGYLLYFEEFLRRGSSAWPPALKRKYANLLPWQGITALKSALRRLTRSHPDQPILLAQRSAQLMRLAAHLLFRPCANVLVTDLNWPPYQEILQKERGQVGRQVTSVPVRDAILRDRATEEEILTLVADEFAEHRCDGLFITAISSDGVRLPVEALVRRLEALVEVRFVVVDGAQELGHGVPDLKRECCDFYLAGCHKWLGAHFPLGLGFYGKRRSRHLVKTLLEQLVRDRTLDDPLLQLTEQVVQHRLDAISETANVAPLFSCQGALLDAPDSEDGLQACFKARLANVRLAAELAHDAGWNDLQPQETFQSGILLLQAQSADLRRLPADRLRYLFQERGVALTAYNSGLIRVSLTGQCWHSWQWERFRRILRRIAGR